MKRIYPTEIGALHLNTYRAGEPGYYSPRKRGTIDVWHDSKRYVYAMSKETARAFKLGIFHAFSDQSSYVVKIRGTYPSYTVEMSE